MRSHRRPVHDGNEAGILGSLLNRFRALARWILLNGLFFLSPRVKLDDIEIVDVAEEKSRDTLHNLERALGVLLEVDPRRYQRLKRDLRRIVLVRAGAPEFASEVGACILRSRYVRESDPQAVATTLVHEATHARLCRLGVSYGPDIRGRVEEICVKEQLAFAERLGDAYILAQLKEKMAHSWWTPEQLHYRRMSGWTDLGLPKWALRFYEWAARGRGRGDR